MKEARTDRSLPRPGPAEYFIGSVRVDPLFDATAPSRVNGGSVTFEPGARTAWHTKSDAKGRDASRVNQVAWYSKTGCAEPPEVDAGAPLTRPGGRRLREPASLQRVANPVGESNRC